MARWLEHAHDTTTYSRPARIASVVAGGALAFATLVAASTTAVADDATPTRVLEPPAPLHDDQAVVGLVVEHGVASADRVGSAAGTSTLGIAAAVSSTEPGLSKITFDQPTDIADAERIAAKIESIPGVTEVSLNTWFTPAALPPGGRTADPYFDDLHGIWDVRDSFAYSVGGKNYTAKLPKGGYATKAPALWRITKGSKRAVVAVLDTGSTPHPDLTANTVNGYDLISSPWTAGDGDGRDSNPNDEGDSAAAYECPWVNPEPISSSWHGTHVAGTIAAVENSVGVVGNAPRAKVQHVRVLGKCGGTMEDIADGITWASGGKVKGTKKNKTPAKVLNLSIQSQSACTPYLQKAINGARKRGSVIIAAAGNHGANASTSAPGNCKNVITVGATDFLGSRTSYSNYGSNLDLSAPGGAIRDWGNDAAGIYSTHNGGTRGQGSATYTPMQGTSMATPGVAGVAALVVALRPKISTKQLERVIRQSVSRFPNQSQFGEFNCAKTKVCGKGLIDATRVPTTFIAKPKVSNARVGRKATVKPKAAAPKAKFTYQWLRNGKKIKGATKKTYKVSKKDLGKRLSVKVTAKYSGFPSRSTTTAKVKVKKNSPSVSVKLKKKTIKRSQRASLAITVKAGVTSRPTGKLKVTYGKKSKTYTLKKSRKGKLTVRLPKLKKGKHTIRVKYTPAKSLKKYVGSKSSKKITLRVR